MGADLVAVGRAVVVDPEWLSKVRSKSEASILAGLPKDELDIAGALSIPPRMVAYLLSRPGGSLAFRPAFRKTWPSGRPFDRIGRASMDSMKRLEAKRQFSTVASNGGFWPKKVQNALSFNGS